jgi:hypothetical protein
VRIRDLQQLAPNVLFCYATFLVRRAFFFAGPAFRTPAFLAEAAFLTGAAFFFAGIFLGEPAFLAADFFLFAGLAALLALAIRFSLTSWYRGTLLIIDRFAQPKMLLD